MKDRRHMADDHPAGECGQHENVEGDKARHRDGDVHCGSVQAAFAGDLMRGGGAAAGTGAASLAASPISLPPWVSAVLARISSFQSMVTMLSFSIRASRLN